MGDVRDQALKNRQGAIRDAAGDADKSRSRQGANKEARDYQRRIEDAQNFAKSLREETDAIGKNRVELKMAAAERAALAAPTKELATDIRNAAAAWKSATIADETRKLRQELGDLNDQTKFENSLLGMNAEQRAVANAQREIELKLRALERQGIDVNTSAIKAETDAYIANARARGRSNLEADNAAEFADAVGHMNSNLQAATSEFSNLFGTAGKGFADLMNTLGDYYQFQADQEAKLADVRARYGDQSREYLAAQMDAREEATAHELDSYGRVISGVKSMFSQKSDAYKAMEAIEKAYAAVRLALAVKEILTETLLTTTKVGGASARMAADATETASSVAKSGIRAAADGVAAFAKTLASLPFPFNLAAGAAVLAALVSVGVKIAGGGKKSAAAEADTTVAQTTNAYAGPVDEYGNPLSQYSVLKAGRTVAGSNDNAPTVGTSGNAPGNTNLTVAPVYHIDARGAADGVEGRIKDVLDAHQQQTVQLARQAAAKDRAASAGRQRIGGA